MLGAEPLTLMVYMYLCMYLWFVSACIDDIVYMCVGGLHVYVCTRSLSLSLSLSLSVGGRVLSRAV
jgi:hypothetical protein